MSHIKIEKISIEDNEAIANLIKNVLIEFGAPKVGTAYEDEALLDMCTTYKGIKKAYFILKDGNKVIGGAGIAPLGGCQENICELQKMYFSSVARNRGLGVKMIQKCLDEAKNKGFKKCYLETLPYMKAAQKLYKKVGFVNIDAPLGDTGHYNCTTYMIKKL